MKQLVILDLDNTLYDEKEYFSGVFTSFENEYGAEPGMLLEAFDSICRPKSRDILKDTLVGALSYTQEKHDALFSCYRSSKFELCLPESSICFLEFLRSRSIQTAILTNGVVAVQKNKVANLNIAPLIDEVFYARENSGHYEKPDARCFQYILQSFGCKPEQAIMIGDSYENDYLGAKEANIKSLWLKGNNFESIDTLEQALPFILEQNNEEN